MTKTKEPEVAELTDEEIEFINAEEDRMYELLSRIPHTVPDGERVYVYAPHGKEDGGKGAGRRPRSHGRNKCVGIVTPAGVWFKSVREKDKLRIPPAIAFTREALHRYQKVVTGFQVWDVDEQKMYFCSRREFLENRQVLDRGFGEQSYLEMRHWHVSEPHTGAQLQLELL